MSFRHALIVEDDNGNVMVAHQGVAHSKEGLDEESGQAQKMILTFANFNVIIERHSSLVEERPRPPSHIPYDDVVRNPDRGALHG